MFFYPFDFNPFTFVRIRGRGRELRPPLRRRLLPVFSTTWIQNYLVLIGNGTGPVLNLGNAQGKSCYLSAHAGVACIDFLSNSH